MVVGPKRPATRGLKQGILGAGLVLHRPLEVTVAAMATHKHTQSWGKIAPGRGGGEGVARAPFSRLPLPLGWGSPVRPFTGQLVAWNVHGAPPWHWTQGKKIQEVPSQFWKGNQPFLFSSFGNPPCPYVLPPQREDDPPPHPGEPYYHHTHTHTHCGAQKLRQKTKA